MHLVSASRTIVWVCEDGFLNKSVMPHCRTTVQPSTFVLTTDDKSQPFAKLKEVFCTTQADPKTPHLILPNRTANTDQQTCLSDLKLFSERTLDLTL